MEPTQKSRFLVRMHIYLYYLWFVCSGSIFSFFLGGSIKVNHQNIDHPMFVNGEDWFQYCANLKRQFPFKAGVHFGVREISHGCTIHWKGCSSLSSISTPWSFPREVFSPVTSSPGRGEKNYGKISGAPNFNTPWNLKWQANLLLQKVVLHLFLLCSHIRC